MRPIIIKLHEKKALQFNNGPTLGHQYLCSESPIKEETKYSIATRFKDVPYLQDYSIKI